MTLKKFIIRFSIFVALIFALDFTLAEVLSHFVNKWQHDNRLGKILTHNEKSNIIILGSSRSFNTVKGKEIHDITKASVYNYGYQGTDVFFHEFMLKLLLKNDCHPKMIILPLDEHQEFFIDTFITFRLDFLYPWAKYSDIRDEINEKEGYKYYSLSRSFFYKKCDLGRKYAERNQKLYPHFDEFGPLPREDISLTYDTLTLKPFKKYMVQNENKKYVNKFLSIVKICQQNNIQLLLVSPPNYYITDDTFNNRILELIKPYKNAVLYVNRDTKYLDKKWFFDRFHLNTSGAVMYSKELAQFIVNQKLLK